MKRGLVWTLVGILSFALVGSAATFLYAVRPILYGDRAGADPVRVDIPGGSSLGDIAARLAAARVIDHPMIFRQYGTLAKFDRQVRAGEYEFVAGESYRRILERLRQGDIIQVKVTIREGLTCKEIATILHDRLGVNEAEFLKLTADPELLRRHSIDSPSFEGFLFPDTYFFPSRTTALQALEAMLQRFFVAWTPAHEERARAIGMTRGQVLTLASIIEGEALLDSERQRISTVYHNRLRRDMLLQADPTVLYALGGVRRRVLYSDLRAMSPYNTYVNRGLPPGPICNAGLGSIDAALSPYANNDELFFVAARDGTGRHVFTTNLDDHMAAKRRADILMAKPATPTAEQSSEDLAPPVPGSSPKKSKATTKERSKSGS